MKRQSSLIFVGFAFGIACLAIGAIQEDNIIKNYYVVQDKPYKKDGSDYEREHCKLDLYMPKGCENFPILIWFHGGGLKIGDKNVELITQLGKLLAAKGVGVAIVNYRLYPKVKYPE